MISEQIWGPDEGMIWSFAAEISWRDNQPLCLEAGDYQIPWIEYHICQVSMLICLVGRGFISGAQHDVNVPVN